MVQPGGWSTAVRRRGGTLGGLLLTLSVVGTLTVTTVVVAPRYLAADGPHEPQGVPAGHPAHQELIDNVAQVIARSVGVLAIHERGPTPYMEMVLWLTDHPRGVDGRPDDRELAVLSHSAVLQTITIYCLPLEDQANHPPPNAARRDSPAFCDRWRANPHVVPLVLARGVASMRVEPVGGAQDEWSEWGIWGGLQRLRLTLTWASDSADGPDEASAIVHTVIFPSPEDKEIEGTGEASGRLLGGTRVPARPLAFAEPTGQQ